VIETGLGSPVLCSPKLDSGEVHVWRARLDLDAASVAALARILSTDELQRAMRFRRALDCHHFVAARAILRLILGSYLNVEPARIVFTRSPFGKPAVRLPKEGGPLHFNLSHSHGLTLYAISRDFEVGIDIEHIQPRLASLHLAQQFPAS
jgi:4'-phosphopantetheinyl transferase